ncbi:VOC family protein [Streptomyces sp. NBC_00053]|uniref:VOC family protein n=1 Tax=unclassified Streptomyces TaxID=2593676 RepID=UPI000F5BDE97|nr:MULTISPECIES: VOC family protein [unclassified Streptomyces]WSX02470.1 VOC family protein [Streptomyces sp. NBC_00987]MCX4395617.1 VOC family protein [Streptomyces sp. NBC_01767]MCX5101751.1 VOC family protein [Streptomyces sp. NBC_00439]MCX5501548.1 VOC family protein [Streptomyces sp. NBC_00052]MCX5549917.1 VOC family protein [Streptomyces sp. NBC_00051]
MAVQPEGTPCWADAMFADLDGAKSFYGEVLGWTFGESSSEFGNYTQAYADGKAVAAVVPPMPGQEGHSAWCLYLASPDAEATAAKIRDNGGETLMDPMQVGDFGTMMLARDPGGVVFGVWQAGTHEGFEAQAVPGAFCWAEVFTREPEKSDAFFPAVFPYSMVKMADEHVDFRMYNLGDKTVMGRMKMGDEFPPEVPPYLNVYFTVADCDAAVAKATERGGVLRFGPMTMPFGRFAALTDPQGAAFSVIDVNTTEGDVPKTSPVS